MSNTKPFSKNKKNKSSSLNFGIAFAAAIFLAVLVFAVVKINTLCPNSEITAKQPTFLYVQTAHSGTLSSSREDGKRTLKLQGVSPVTAYFSERPNKLTGHESTEEFISEWSEGEDSFGDSPPNAALDIIGNNSQSIAIVELMSAKYDSTTQTLEYEILMLEDETAGNIPESFGEVALFIDSAWKDYHCNCEPSSGKKECKCRYRYTLGKSSTKEFRGYCNQDSTYPSGISVTGRKSATSCTVRIFEQLYATRSCTNWDPTSRDELNITVHCSKR